MIDADDVLYLLRCAGATMLRMPGNSISLQLSRIAVDAVGDPRTAYGYTEVALNRVVPSAREIDLMDLVYPWLSQIPDQQILLRKVVGHRMLWNWDRDKSIWPYKKLAKKLHCDQKAIPRWENQGVETILRSVNRNYSVLTEISLYLRLRERPYTGYGEEGVGDSTSSALRL